MNRRVLIGMAVFGLVVGVGSLVLPYTSAGTRCAGLIARLAGAGDTCEAAAVTARAVQAGLALAVFAWSGARLLRRT